MGETATFLKCVQFFPLKNILKDAGVWGRLVFRNNPKCIRLQILREKVGGIFFVILIIFIEPSRAALFELFEVEVAQFPIIFKFGDLVVAVDEY